MRASFDYSQLIDCAEGRLFGNANARLPAPPMLMIDRVVNIDDDGGAHRDGAVHPGDGTRHGPDAGPRHPPADAGS